jgi:hypothetical protein
VSNVGGGFFDASKCHRHRSDIDGSCGGYHSPLVANRTARMQIRANLISANRQAWIDKLRDELAELFELLTWRFLQRPGTYSGEESHKYEAEKRSRIRFLKHKIRLRLNPLETDSRSLLDLLTRLEESAARGSGGDDSDFEELLEAAVIKSQTILKAEWLRVKEGR